MKSELPKGMHLVCGVPILEFIVQAMNAVGVARPIMVVGHGGEAVVDYFGERCAYAWQHDQLGTGHAAQMVVPLLSDDASDVLLTPGDTPLIEGRHFDQLLGKHRATQAAATVASFLLDDPTGYGRVIRGPDGEVRRIVEHKDANDDERMVREVNSAVYCFNSSRLKEALGLLTNDNAQGEYYLTDVIRILSEAGADVFSEVVEDSDAFRGVNDRWQLAEAGSIKKESVLRGHALAGVSIVDPASTFVGIDVQVGRDTVILPNTVIEGHTTIGESCEIGPNTRIADSFIGDRCEVLMSHVNRAMMQSDSRCGPFANLRPGAKLGTKVKIGNFVEVKNAVLHDGVSVSHLSYVGDGEVGARTNIGAGTIFCNYDGFRKSRTEIGQDAFIGSNTTLVAPVTIGDGAMVAAGSVITKSVPPGSLGLGRARQENKEQWVEQWRNRKASEDQK